MERERTRICKNCAHWSPGSEHVDQMDYDDGTVGECRRDAPIMTVGDNSHIDTGEAAIFGFWALTVAHKWCGDWKLAEDASLDTTAKALAETVLAGDMTAARALADKVREA